MLHTLFSRNSTRRRRHAFCAEPSIEYLETRMLLATFNWVPAADGDFGNPENWLNTTTNTAGVPGAGDIANIAQTVVVTSSVNRTVNAVGGGGRLHITGGTFTIQNVNASSTLNGFEIDPGAILRTTGGTTAIVGSEISGRLTSTDTGTIRFLRGQNNLKAGASLSGNGQFIVSGDVFGGPSVTLLTSITAPQHFLLENGSLNGSGNLTISGTFDWIQGGAGGTTMAGTGQTIVQPGATLNIGGGGVTLSQRSLINQGTVSFFATGNISVNSNALIENQSGAVFDFQTDSDIDAGGGGAGGVFINAGTVMKTAGNDVSGLSIVFNNTGLTDVQTGQIALRAGTSTNATFNTSPSTFLLLTSFNSTYQLAGTTSLNGSGTILTAGGTVTTVGGDAAVNVSATANLQFTGGTLVVPTESELSINGALTIPGASNSVLRGGGTLTVNGNIAHTGVGALLIGGDLASNTIPTTLNIPSGRIYNFQGDGDITPTGPGGVIINAGTIRKPSGAGQSLIGVVVQSSSAIRALSGTLTLHTTTSTGGVVSAASGATVQLTDNSGATFTQVGALQIQGLGGIQIPAGTIGVGANGGSFTVAPNSTLHWSGGTFRIPVGQTTRISGNMTVGAAADVLLAGGGNLSILGSVAHVGDGNLRIDGDGFNSSTRLTIAQTGSWNLGSDADLVFGSGGGGVIDNLGSITKTGGAGTSRITAVLNQAANLMVNSGTVQLAPASGIVQGGVIDVSAGAVLELTGNNGTTTMSGTFSGSGAGQVRLNSGTVAAGSGDGPLTFDFPAGLMQLAGGTIDTATQDVVISGVASLVGANVVTVSGGGRLILQGTLNHQGTAGLNLTQNTTLNIAAGGAYTLKSNAGIAGVGVIVVDGTLKKTAGTSQSLITVPVSNNGRIEARRGTLKLSGSISEFLAGTLTGGTWSASSTATTNATLDLSVNVTAIDLSATVILSGPNSSIPSISNLNTIAGRLTLANGASYSNSGDLSNNGNLLLGAGSVLDVSGSYLQGFGSRVTYQMVGSDIGRIRTFADVSLAGGIAFTFTGTRPAIGTEVTIIENQGSRPVSGTFSGRPQGATVNFGGMTWTISYEGGTGNDVVLTRQS